MIDKEDEISMMIKNMTDKIIEENARELFLSSNKTYLSNAIQENPQTSLNEDSKDLSNQDRNINLNTNNFNHNSNNLANSKNSDYFRTNSNINSERFQNYEAKINELEQNLAIEKFGGNTYLSQFKPPQNAIYSKEIELIESIKNKNRRLSPSGSPQAYKERDERIAARKEKMKARTQKTNKETRKSISNNKLDKNKQSKYREFSIIAEDQAFNKNSQKEMKLSNIRYELLTSDPNHQISNFDKHLMDKNKLNTNIRTDFDTFHQSIIIKMKKKIKKRKQYIKKLTQICYMKMNYQKEGKVAKNLTKIKEKRVKIKIKRIKIHSLKKKEYHFPMRAEY